MCVVCLRAAELAQVDGGEGEGDGGAREGAGGEDEADEGLCQEEEPV